MNPKEVGKKVIELVQTSLTAIKEVRQRRRDQYYSAGMRTRPHWKRPKGVSRRQWKRDRMAYLRETKKAKKAA